MDESAVDPSSALRVQSLLVELEDVIVLESRVNGNAWVHVSKLTNYCFQKYGQSLEVLLHMQEKAVDIKSLLRQSGRFALYSTPVPGEFYVALLNAVVWVSPLSPQCLPAKPNSGSRKRIQPFRSRPVFKTVPQPTQTYGGPSAIASATDLQQALVAIATHLTANREFVTIAALSQTFGALYGQPIRAVLQNVCPGLKLVGVLQSMPELHVQKSGNDWRITVASRN
ncbi:hypothetical protein ACQ4M4_10390 [Leptolyngbya sp. AN02str]|uniref:hypothetical protein n=1 Tax=Leptolyngbya sp. AN02str TaxID=3423363 RepID=UPI003D3232FE